MPKELIAFVSTVVATFVGASAAFLFAMWKASADRRADFRRQQLTEFYSPIAGYARRVRALLAMSKTVLEATEKGWQDVLEAHYTDRLDNDGKRFAKIIEYENAQLDDELLPTYRAILEVFTSKYSFAQPSTREFYEVYYAFVDHWERVKRDTLPTEVREHLLHDDKMLQHFFEHLESTLQMLQNELVPRRGRARSVTLIP